MIIIKDRVWDEGVGNRRLDAGSDLPWMVLNVNHRLVRLGLGRTRETFRGTHSFFRPSSRLA